MSPLPLTPFSSAEMVDHDCLKAQEEERRRRQQEEYEKARRPNLPRPAAAFPGQTARPDPVALSPSSAASLLAPVGASALGRSPTNTAPTATATASATAAGSKRTGSTASSRGGSARRVFGDEESPFVARRQSRTEREPVAVGQSRRGSTSTRNRPQRELENPARVVARGMVELNGRVQRLPLQFGECSEREREQKTKQKTKRGREKKEKSNV